MYKGLKPTRLWYLTGKKYMERCIRDRITAIKGHDYDQRINYEIVKLMGFVYAAALGFVYSYGFFGPEKYFPAIKKTIGPNEPVTKTDKK